MMKVIRKKFPIFISNPRLAAFCSFSITFFLFSVLVFTSSYPFYTTEAVKAEEPKTTQSTGKFILEVHISRTGMVLLQGAKVESMQSKNTILVSTTWDDTVLLWTVNTNESYYGKHHFGTNFLDSRGINVAITDIRVGDFISITGTLNFNSSTPTIKADVIRISH